jgi:hypothetical protein
MTIESTREKISFAIEGSLIDLNNQEVPNFNRLSPIWLERTVNGGFQCYPVAAFYPAFEPTGAFVIDPGTLNLLSWNMDLTQSVWLKGSNTIIFPDEIPSADTSYMADLIVFAPGSGITQVVKRTIELIPGKDYTLSAIMGIKGDGIARFGDEIKISGDVVAPVTLSLENLNSTANRYSLMELKFRTSGNAATLPGQEHSGSFAVTALTADTLTIVIPDGSATALNEFVGGNIGLSSNTLKEYKITANTAMNLIDRKVVLTVEPATLTADGATTASTVLFRGVNLASVDIEIYVESTISLMFSGMQIEQKTFRTPFIFQEGNLLVRSKTTLVYRKNPLAGLRSFGIFAEIKEWRGDGNLFSTGNLSATITNGKLVVVAGATIISLAESLPTSFKLFLQVSQESNTISVYLDNILKGRSTAPSFTGSTTSSLAFSSDGFRIWERFFVVDKILLDRQLSIEGAATNEVSELFSTEVIIDPVAITVHNPIIKLFPVTVPGKELPLAETTIEEITIPVERKITVGNASELVPGSNVDIFREDKIILSTTIEAIVGNLISLSSIASLIPGDRVVYGYTTIPGTASIRFPYTPKDAQRILAITDNRLTVSSTLSFSKGLVFFTNLLYEDIAEGIISSIDNINSYLYLSVANEDIEVGDVISQAANEMSVDPANYFYGLLSPAPGVEVGSPHTNGIIAYNNNSYPVQISPYVRIYL